MLILQGKARKSIILQELINTGILTDNIVVLDSVVIKNMRLKDGVEHFILASNFSIPQLFEIFETNHKQDFSKYEWVAFEINVPKDDFNLNDFLALEKKYNQKFIVTVQDNDMVDVKVFYA
jgi:hypothetical protein